MKKIFLVYLMMGLSNIAISQNYDTTTYVYCKALSISNIVMTLNKTDDVEIYLDFGAGKIFTPKHPMKDEAGKDVDFETVVDLMNFMSERKWQLDIAYQTSITTSVVRLVTNLVFKKPKYKNS